VRSGKVSETLAFLGPDSVATARAALAAGEQDRYWNYAVLLFLNQGPENSGYATDEFLRRLANEVRRLDVDRWNEARDSGSVESELEAVQDRAQEAGVDGTPTLIISGPGGGTHRQGRGGARGSQGFVSERSTRALLAALSVAGLLVSAYLTWTHLRGVAPVCVGGTSGCGTVQTSRYSEILGVPVAALGLAGYASLLLSALLKGEAGVFFGLFVALVGVLFSGYLTWLELFVIEAICQWCVVCATLMVASLFFAALRVRHLGTSNT
jgi:uncharacterized membrane protein